MKDLATIKTENENKVSELIKDSLMFFAFSNEQFLKNKTPLQEGEKYVSIGMGAYIPKGKVDFYLDGIAKISKWFKEAIDSNELKKENILYELFNHEAFYTNDIVSTLEALGNDYSDDEVMEVFRIERNKQNLES